VGVRAQAEAAADHPHVQVSAGTSPAGDHRYHQEYIVTIKRINCGKGHRYTIDGKRAVGVTTALKGIPKDALKYWAAREVAQYAVRNIYDVKRMLDSGGPNPTINFLKEIPFQVRDDAAIRGTEVHAIAERYIKGDEVEVSDHLRPYVEGYAAFIEDWNPTSVHEELVVASRTHMYAGTLDSIQDIPSLGRAQVDYKTGSGVYGEYVLQVAGYRYAEVFLDAEGNEQPMIPVDRTFVLHIQPGGYELLPVKADEEAFDRFLAALANYRANIQGSPLDELIGQPMAPPSREAA
jgi:hypothetical protein